MEELQCSLKESVNRYENQAKEFEAERLRLQEEIRKENEEKNKLATELHNSNILISALEEQSIWVFFINFLTSSNTELSLPDEAMADPSIKDSHEKSTFK